MTHCLASLFTSCGLLLLSSVATYVTWVLQTSQFLRGSLNLWALTTHDQLWQCSFKITITSKAGKWRSEALFADKAVETSNRRGDEWSHFEGRSHVLIPTHKTKIWPGLKKAAKCSKLVLVPCVCIHVCISARVNWSESMCIRQQHSPECTTHPVQQYSKIQNQSRENTVNFSPPIKRVMCSIKGM